MDIYQERIRPLFDGSSETNAEIERKLGIPAKTINKWNNTPLKSWRNYIPQIASYFHVSTDYLLGKTDDTTQTEQKESPPQSGEPSKEALLEIVNNTDDEAFLLEIMSAVAARMKERNERK